jgi:hypothetical protein
MTSRRQQTVIRNFCIVAIVPLSIVIIALLFMGCASKPPTGFNYPANIRAQCEEAYNAGRSMYVERWGQPIRELDSWTVYAEKGRPWGSQWAIMQGGQLVGGYTSGKFSTIGCGPDGQVNQGDLNHEALESWAYVNEKRVH